MVGASDLQQELSKGFKHISSLTSEALKNLELSSPLAVLDQITSLQGAGEKVYSQKSTNPNIYSTPRWRWIWNINQVVHRNRLTKLLGEMTMLWVYLFAALLRYMLSTHIWDVDIVNQFYIHLIYITWNKTWIWLHCVGLCVNISTWRRGTCQPQQEAYDRRYVECRVWPPPPDVCHPKAGQPMSSPHQSERDYGHGPTILSLLCSANGLSEAGF